MKTMMIECEKCDGLGWLEDWLYDLDHRTVECNECKGSGKVDGDDDDE